MRRPRNPATWAALVALAAPGPAFAAPRDDPATASPGTAATSGIVCPPPPCGPIPPKVIRYAPTVSFLPGPFGFVPYAPPLIVASGPVVPLVAVPPFPTVLVPAPGPLFPPIAPPPFPPIVPPPFPPIVADRGLGRGAEAQPARPEPAPRRSAGPSERAEDLVTFGDRHFRAGSLRFAERRYRQALAAAPLAASPRIRMAQLALVRGSFREAADWLREAILAEPSWLSRPRDVQDLYAEPADFHAVLGTLEAHLQADPGDRDAWLVLGAQLYLSGRVERAVDVFHRLADRRPESAVAALIAASDAALERR